MPGSIFSTRSSGSNELIKKGAKLVASAGDITEEYGYNLNIFEDKANISTQNTTQKNILDILVNKGETTTDEIVSSLPAFDTSDILSSLSMLEINGLVKKLSNGKYRKA